MKFAKLDYARALAELTDCFLERHECFPLDNPRWKEAMSTAYTLVGQPNTEARKERMVDAGEPEEPVEKGGNAFVDDWNAMIATISAFGVKYDLPQPDMLYPPTVLQRMRSIARETIAGVIIWRGVRIRFGRYESMDVLRPA